MGISDSNLQKKGCVIFMLFPVLDQQGSFRKEILLFAFLSMLCAYLISSDKGIPKRLSIYIVIIASLIILSHEMLVVYLPYIACAFIIQENGLRNNTKRILISLIPGAAIAIFLMIFFKGDSKVVVDICNSLKSYSPATCLEKGAIASLGWDVLEAHDFVQRYINTSSLSVYIITTILSMLPLFLIISKKPFSIFLRNKSIRIWVGLCITSSIIGSIPLFWVVADYGRIIYIHVTCISILVLMINSKLNNITNNASLNQVFSWGLCFLYVTNWRLIHLNASFDTAFPLITKIINLLGRF